MLSHVSVAFYHCTISIHHAGTPSFTIRLRSFSFSSSRRPLVLVLISSHLLLLVLVAARSSSFVRQHSSFHVQSLAGHQNGERIASIDLINNTRCSAFNCLRVQIIKDGDSSIVLIKNVDLVHI
jgi:hypothetical protein